MRTYDLLVRAKKWRMKKMENTQDYMKKSKKSLELQNENNSLGEHTLKELSLQELEDISGGFGGLFQVIKAVQDQNKNIGRNVQYGARRLGKKERK